MSSRFADAAVSAECQKGVSAAAVPAAAVELLLPRLPLLPLLLLLLDPCLQALRERLGRQSLGPRRMSVRRRRESVLGGSC